MSVFPSVQGRGGDPPPYEHMGPLPHGHVETASLGNRPHPAHLHSLTLVLAFNRRISKFHRVFQKFEMIQCDNLFKGLPAVYEKFLDPER